MAEHTPGPWRVSGSQMRQLSGPPDLLIEHGDDQDFSPLIAQIHSDGGRLPAEANARLIAAAPEILTALEKVCDALEISTGPKHERERAVQEAWEGGVAALTQARDQVTTRA